MFDYASLKILHVSAVSVSISLFLFRAVLMLRRSELAQRWWIPHASHAVDTVLLGAAIGMVWVGGRQIFGEAWLTTKLTFLLAYIVTGALALKRARSERAKRVFLVLALLCLGNIVTIALTRDPWGMAALFRP